MLLRTACVMSLFLTGFAVADTPAADDSKEKLFFSIKLLEQAESGKVKQLVDCDLQVKPQGKIRSFSGGLEPGFQGEQELKFGVWVKGTIKPAENGKYRALLKLRWTERVSQLKGTQETGTQLTKTEAVEIRTFLEKGKTKRLSCGGLQAVELRLD
ncbi:hypothetical protein [Gimesia maris]|uniref:hypothetical protein n=1 Tax=Gimesia maris TaxID=122 RepID=UPI0030DA45BB|tara:strand:+ start:2518 stop:2985 length:468 start_codon:yes stop_codon:yes gene_type:complete